jgi:hypothetical protein
MSFCRSRVVKLWFFTWKAKTAMRSGDFEQSGSCPRLKLCVDACLFCRAKEGTRDVCTYSYAPISGSRMSFTSLISLPDRNVSCLSLTPIDNLACFIKQAEAVPLQQHIWLPQTFVMAIAKVSVPAWSEGRSVGADLGCPQIFLRLTLSQPKFIRIDFCNCQRQHHLNTKKTTR